MSSSDRRNQHLESYHDAYSEHFFEIEKEVEKVDIRESQVQKDGFDLMFRRQGWSDFEYKSPYLDSQVIKLRWIDPPNASKKYSKQAFYDCFGDYTFRKLLRAIFFSPRTYEELKSCCQDQKKLDSHLEFMREQEIAVQEGDVWKKSFSYEQVSGIGPTLEWYVAEWFRLWLQSPARHGVTIKDLADGGDLDVVAFVDGKRIMVECKSGKPENIGETELRLFLRRAFEFGPEMAILLVDTEYSIDKPVEIMNSLRSNGDLLKSQDRHNSLYWGMHHIYAVNTRKSIAYSLSTVLQLYNSKIKYLSFYN
jgi:hypothetical protein